MTTETQLQVEASRWRREPARPVSVAKHEHAWIWAVAAVCVGAFMGQLDASIVTVALPDIGRDLGVGLSTVSWVALVYLLVLITLVVPLGRWADCRGRKLLYLYGFAIFTVASAACALAPNLPVLLAGRAAQAVGAALLQANSVALVVAAAPRDKRGRALAAQGAAQALGLALGPTVGGALLSVGSWRALFFVNLPAGVIGLALAWFLLPRSRDLRVSEPSPRLSLTLFVVAVTAGMLALSSRGVLAATGGVAATLAVIAFVVVDRRAKSPLFGGLFRVPAFRTGVLSGVLGYAVLFGLLFVVPVTTSASAGPAMTGLVLSGLPVAMGLSALTAGRAIDRHGPTAASLTGIGLLAAALALLAATGTPSLPTLTCLLVLAGTGFGIWLPANNTSAMGATRLGRSGLAGGTLNMSRGVGTAIGIALTAQIAGVTAPARVLPTACAVLLGLVLTAAVLTFTKSSIRT